MHTMIRLTFIACLLTVFSPTGGMWAQSDTATNAELVRLNREVVELRRMLTGEQKIDKLRVDLLLIGDGNIAPFDDGIVIRSSNGGYTLVRSDLVRHGVKSGSHLNVQNDGKFGAC